MSIPKITHEAPRGYGRVNLKHSGEKHVFKRQPWASGFLRWFADCFAQFMQKPLEFVFLYCLRFVVGGPLLLVGLLCYLEGFSNDRLAVVCLLMLDRVLDCEDMLAAILPVLIVGTGAVRSGRIGLDRVILRA